MSANNDRPLRRYAKAMKAGAHATAYNIEARYGLSGYSPEIVSVGLRAIEAGDDPQEAIEKHLALFPNADPIMTDATKEPCRG
jgi:hypothetical protein